VVYQLVGAKKVQQVLALPGVLERYLSPDEAGLVRTCFTGIYPLDESSEGVAAYKRGLDNPDSLVMKPQRYRL
jgi:glutathione synthase